MFALKSATRVFVRTGPTDMRLAYEGLYALAERAILQDPKSGHLFVFCNKNRNRLKCLYWDGSGLWVCAKRLERGTFDWPQRDTGAAEMSCTQLKLLLEGFEFKSRPGWYRRDSTPVHTRLAHIDPRFGAQP